MRQPKVISLLLIAILLTTICPMVAALYFVDRALTTSLNLGFNRQIVAVLESGAQNLKALGRLDPVNADKYRAEFERVQELEAVYSSPELIKRSLRHSLTLYFAVGVIATLLLSLGVAIVLSRQISRSFRANFDDLARNRERVRYLEEMASWQELAKMLAHEIKNPLTPIEVLVTSLSKAYLAKPQHEFHAQLEQTATMIGEELSHLKNTVNKFSEFAKLPAVKLTRADLAVYLLQQADVLAAAFNGAEIELALPESRVPVVFDATLLRQVLANIVRNGVEANPDKKVRFKITLLVADNSIRVAIENDGEVVPNELVPRIFDPYVSTKSSKDNMGLGLAIVRKIMLEHGGDAEYTETEGRPTFVLSMPKGT
jgi:signal transduction histidine kinase